MSTHRLGRGTVNVSANLLREERDALSRMATQRDMSISRIIRDAITAAITRQDPRLANGLSRIRRERRRELLGRAQGQLELSL